MELSPANLDKFFTQLEVLYGLALHNAEPWSARLCTPYTATSESILHGWIGMFDKPRVWKGARVVREPAPQTYGVPILPWELTERIDQFKLMDDSYGIYGLTATRIGQSSGKLQDYAVRDMLQGTGDMIGPFQIGADGISQWSASHPVDFWDPSKGTYPNDFSTAGVSVNGITIGGSLSVNAYLTMWQFMTSIPNESGEAIGAVPDVTLAPSNLYFALSVITKSAYFSPPQLGNLGAGAGANAPFVGNMESPLRGSTDVVWTPDLNKQPNAFYMMETKGPMKPLGWALRQAPVFVVRNAPQDPSVFDQHAYLYGMWARATPHWGLPWQALRSGI